MSYNNDWSAMYGYVGSDNESEQRRVEPHGTGKYDGTESDSEEAEKMVYFKKKKSKKKKYIDDDKDDEDTIMAAKGFKGYLKKPTKFLVGESGPEEMYIDPKDDYLHIKSNKNENIIKSFWGTDFNLDLISLTGVDKHEIGIKVNRKSDPFNPENWFY